MLQRCVPKCLTLLFTLCFILSTQALGRFRLHPNHIPQAADASGSKTPDPAPQTTTPRKTKPPKSGSTSTCATPNQFTIEPAEARIAPGGTLNFMVRVPDGCDLPDIEWKVEEKDLGPAMKIVRTERLAKGSSFDLTLNFDFSTLKEAESCKKQVSANKGKATAREEACRTGLAIEALQKQLKDDRSKAFIHVIATATSSGNASPQVARATAIVTPEAVGNIVIPIIGFEQAGASAAQSDQKFFFNLFVNRPLPFGDDEILPDGTNLGTRYRLFGNARIATYPQQITSGIAEFATGFASQVANLQVNKLAQAGEFNLGLDLRFASPQKALYSMGSTVHKEVTFLSFIAGFGGISPMNPQESLQIFVTPPVGSPQRDRFIRQFPSSANSTYTGFITPDRGRFYWEYGAGVRLTTLYLDKSGTQAVTPAMITYSLGQNQVVTRGKSVGLVQRLEGFLPLPLGEMFAKNVTTLYLFGRVDMRLLKPRQETPFVLQPAPPGVNGFDPTVNIVTNPTDRDLYTIGVGVDAVRLIKQFPGLKSNKAPSVPTLP